MVFRAAGLMLALATAGAAQGTRVIAVLGARWPGVPASELTDVIVPLVVGHEEYRERDLDVVLGTDRAHQLVAAWMDLGLFGADSATRQHF